MELRLWRGWRLRLWKETSVCECPGLWPTQRVDAGAHHCVGYYADMTRCTCPTTVHQEPGMLNVGYREADGYYHMPDCPRVSTSTG